MLHHPAGGLGLPSEFCWNICRIVANIIGFIWRINFPMALTRKSAHATVVAVQAFKLGIRWPTTTHISIPQEDWGEFWLAFRRKSISENTQLQLIALSLGVWPEVRSLFSDSVALVLLTLFSKMLFSLIPVTFDFPVRLNYQYTSTPLYFCSFISTSSRYHTNQYT